MAIIQITFEVDDDAKPITVPGAPLGMQLENALLIGICEEEQFALEWLHKYVKSAAFNG